MFLLLGPFEVHTKPMSKTILGFFNIGMPNIQMLEKYALQDNFRQICPQDITIPIFTIYSNLQPPRGCLPHSRAMFLKILSHTMFVLPLDR